VRLCQSPTCQLIRRSRSRSARHNARFLAMLPLIRKQVRFEFRHLPSRIRDERINDAVAHAFVLFARLVRRHRVRLAHPTALARYAVYRVRSRRPIGSRMNSREVTSGGAQRRFGFRLISADAPGRSGCPLWTEMLTAARRSTPAELAAIRIDFAVWLTQLSDRHREIAVSLASGERTSTVAQQYNVSCGRISQIRQELAMAWRLFQGEFSQDGSSM
jgi:hypothetical protein